MPRYQFVVGVSLAALEADLNRIVHEEPSLKLNQVMYAQGTGFVAVVEHVEGAEVARTQPTEKPVVRRTEQRASRRK